jgi:hypothetical protein
VDQSLVCRAAADETYHLLVGPCPCRHVREDRLKAVLEIGGGAAEEREQVAAFARRPGRPPESKASTSSNAVSPRLAIVPQNHWTSARYQRRSSESQSGHVGT